MKGLPIRSAGFPSGRRRLAVPAVLQSGLTREECLLIADYVMNLSDSQQTLGKSRLRYREQ